MTKLPRGDWRHGVFPLGSGHLLSSLHFGRMVTSGEHRRSVIYHTYFVGKWENLFLDPDLSGGEVKKTHQEFTTLAKTNLFGTVRSVSGFRRPDRKCISAKLPTIHV